MGKVEDEAMFRCVAHRRSRHSSKRVERMSKHSFMSAKPEILGISPSALAMLDLMVVARTLLSMPLGGPKTSHVSSFGWTQNLPLEHDLAPWKQTSQ